MTEEPLEPFDHALLKEERAAPLTVDASAQARVLLRLETMMAPVAAAAATSGAVTHVAASAAGKNAIALAFAMGITGAVAGSAVTALVMRRPVMVVQGPSVIVTQPAAPPASLETEKAVVAGPALKVPVKPKPVVAPTVSTLAYEQDQIETARAAILSRRFDAALSVLEQHGREFQQGALAEEREALTIQALGLSGRDNEARAKASEFRRRFAGSMFMPAIDAISAP